MTKPKKSLNVTQDYIDEVIEQWNREVPELPTDGLEIGGRIVVIQKHLERLVEKSLAPFELQIWGFDVLASLLRSGPPYTQTPTQLMRNCFLSSGAVTNRVNRLADRGLVVRKRATEDKRSITVTLTEEGLTLAHKAIRGRIDFMVPLFDNLTPKEHEHLVGLLRKTLCRFEDRTGWR